MKARQARTMVADRLANDGACKILDIGGGANCQIKVPYARYTVVDNSPEALARNTSAHERLLCDAQHLALPERNYDAVVLWNVLEHIPEPELVVRSAIDHLRPSGTIVIAGPILSSLKSMIARRTPYSFHVWVYKNVLKKHGAGQPGNSPFPIEHNPSSDLPMLQEIILQSGFSIVDVIRYDGSELRRLKKKSPALSWAYQHTNQLLQSVLPKHVSPHSEFVLIARKPLN